MVHNLEDLFWFILTACKVSTHIFAYSFVVCVNYKCMNYYQYCGFSLLNISIEENQPVRRVKHLFEFARLSFNFEISDKFENCIAHPKSYQKTKYAFANSHFYRESTL